MIIKKVKLHNIRSYTDEEINFPEGSLLLSGDIGSGKTTILLGIEFCLFGLRKNELSGEALLRKGAKEGYVEIEFFLDSKIVIKRNLKRSGDSVGQENGFIIIDNEKIELSPLEIKQKVIELLQYPAELISKSKDFIYRYTVYTPQEEMKAILNEDSEVRLDTLRRVFGIDKYKRIKENSKIISQRFRERIKNFEGRLSNFDYLSNELKINEKYLEVEKNEIIPVLIEIEKNTLEINEKKEKVKKIQEKIENRNKINKDLEIKRLSLKFKLEKIERNKSDIKKLEEDVLRLNNEIKDVEFEPSTLIEIKKKIDEYDAEIRKIDSEVYSLDSLIKTNNENISKIESMKLCPICKQDVNDGHKKTIRDEGLFKINESNERILILNTKKNEIKEKLALEKKIYDSIMERKSLFEAMKLRKRSLDEKKTMKENLFNEILKFDNEILKFNEEITALEIILSEIKDISDENEVKELDNLMKILKSFEIKKAEINTKIRNYETKIKEVKGRIEEQIITRNKLEKLLMLKNYIENDFLNALIEIERKVMLRINYDFNNLFSKWFELLVEGQNIKVRLDDEFSVIIDENNYLIDYNHLSGGEKTAIALAYRLALNQVINNLVSTIKTKDLIILDEPTDGFSEEQLDRLKVVLDELQIKQIIIVSHEAKVEGFVDNVIRIEKKNHVSKVFR